MKKEGVTGSVWDQVILTAGSSPFPGAADFCLRAALIWMSRVKKMFAVVPSVSGTLTVWEVLIEAWDICLRVTSFLPHQQPHEEVLFETVLEMKNHRCQGRWPSPPHPGMQTWTVCRTLFILLLPPTHGHHELCSANRDEYLWVFQR